MADNNRASEIEEEIEEIEERLEEILENEDLRTGQDEEET